MSRYEDNLAGFYKFFAQALVRHGYTTKKRDGETFAFLKPFEYGHFIFSFSVHEDTGLIRVSPPQASFDAVEKILQRLITLTSYSSVSLRVHLWASYPKPWLSSKSEWRPHRR